MEQLVTPHRRHPIIPFTTTGRHTGRHTVHRAAGRRYEDGGSSTNERRSTAGEGNECERSELYQITRQLQLRVRRHGTSGALMDSIVRI